eukprot:scaffold3161_cov247-Ochromonas_danica.AAC.8
MIGREHQHDRSIINHDWIVPEETTNSYYTTLSSDHCHTLLSYFRSVATQERVTVITAESGVVGVDQVTFSEPVDFL